ncbi:MAG: acyl-ACP thioesterase domain-containing protein, partial [Acidimicrobiaceae bacterium]
MTAAGPNDGARGVQSARKREHETRPAPSALPESGRRFSVVHKVRLGDVTPKGRLRLDAVARYLQDVATDDSLDGGYDEPHSWVVRRTQMWVTSFPKYLDQVELTTW